MTTGPFNCVAKRQFESECEYTAAVQACVVSRNNVHSLGCEWTTERSWARYDPPQIPTPCTTFYG